MLGENNTQELQRLGEMKLFKESESELVDFLIKHNRIPNYVDERRQYQILLRLNRKLRDAKQKVMIYSNLFEVIDKIKVSNKLVGGSVD